PARPAHLPHRRPVLRGPLRSRRRLRDRRDARGPPPAHRARDRVLAVRRGDPHRDSIGSHALVRPGDVDLMVAGSGITHSEFSANDTTVLHGVQLWYALPDRTRFREQEFLVHTPTEVATGTARARVGLRTLHGVDGDRDLLEDASPVVTDADLGMAQLELRAGSTLRLGLDPGHEHGVLVERGTARLTTARGTGPATGGTGDESSARSLRADVAPRELMVLPDGVDHLEIVVTGDEDLRLIRSEEHTSELQSRENLV